MGYFTDKCRQSFPFEHRTRQVTHRQSADALVKITLLISRGRSLYRLGEVSISKLAFRSSVTNLVNLPVVVLEMDFKMFIMVILRIVSHVIDCCSVHSEQHDVVLC